MIATQFDNINNSNNKY